MTDSSTQLLADLTSLRSETRNARHAYWLPVGVFGLLVCAAAPMYITAEIVCPGQAECSAGLQPAWTAQWLNGLGGGVRGAYWTFVLIAGALVTWAWYAWYGRVTGLATIVRGPVAAWAAGLFFAATTVSFAGLAGFASFHILPGRGFFPLLVIGLGLLVLGVLERSPLLSTVAVLTCAWAWVLSLYNPENVVFRMLSVAGLPSDRIQPTMLFTVDVLIPGLLLTGTAVAAFLADFRRR